VIRVTERMWSTGDDLSIETMRELMTRHLDHVGPALVGNWRTN
jgi:hypothetical protein